MPRYTTRQREALLDYLSRHPDQPLTVREIAAGVEPDGVSLSAVYRNLAELEAAGLIRRESRPGSREAVVQYVGAENCRGHLHLTCTRCGRTVHLSSAAAEQNHACAREHCAICAQYQQLRQSTGAAPAPAAEPPALPRPRRTAVSLLSDGSRTALSPVMLRDKLSC